MCNIMIRSTSETFHEEWPVAVGALRGAPQAGVSSAGLYRQQMRYLSEQFPLLSSENDHPPCASQACIARKHAAGDRAANSYRLQTCIQHSSAAVVLL